MNLSIVVTGRAGLNLSRSSVINFQVSFSLRDFELARLSLTGATGMSFLLIGRRRKERKWVE